MVTETADAQARLHGPELGYDLLSALRKIVSYISEHSKRIKRESGLTVPQLMVLKTIGDLRHEQVTIHAVADTVHLTDATVSRIVERLVRAGNVIRERDKQDRRKVCLTLSEAGMAKYRSMPTPLHEDFLIRFAELEAAKRAEIMACLESLAELMGEDNGDEGDF
ncbi:MarR family transcriptional regulator [bacterium]|nr:MarR family transcriptional regulator [bacterium]